MTGPTDPSNNPDQPDLRPDAEMEHTPRRRRQPALAVAALIGIILLVLAVGIFGGIF